MNNAIESTEVVTYSQRSAPLRLARDRDADGKWDTIEAHQYDAEGRPERDTTDADNDGAVDWIRAYFYDGDGRLVRTEDDDGADGVVDSMMELIYNSSGQVTHMLLHHRLGATDDYEFQYDVRGRPISRRLRSRLTRYIWDDARVIRIIESDDSRSEPLEVDELEYNPRGFIARWVADRPVDGSVDQVTEWTYDSHNWLVRSRRTYGSAVEWQIDYEYDALGRLLLTTVVGAGTGSFRVVSVLGCPR